MLTREQIAAVLATVPGLDASALWPELVVGGSAWPSYTEATPFLTMACVEWAPSWQVYVALPNGTRRDAIEAGDAMLAAVGQVLYDAGLAPERVETLAVQIAPGGTDTLPALRFTLAP